MSTPTLRNSGTAFSPADSRILIVDVEQSASALLERGLEDFGYKVDRVTSARDALHSLALRRYDAMLAQIDMPEMRGDELHRKVMEQHPDIAVLVFTTVNDIHVAVRCLQDGAMDYVTMPFDVDDVGARISHALKRRSESARHKLHNSLLEQQVAEQSQKISHLKLVSLQSLNRALEAKDESTRNHSARVAALSRAIAENMGITDERTVATITLAALLHDIGKIGVPEEVLNKAGKLEPHEFEHIKRHPELGEMILKPLLAKDILAIVRHHHERYDGGGYPDGLRAEDVPLGARIIAVADAYDAMTSERPYRAGMPRERALAVLAAGANSQWFKPVVDSMLAVAEMGLLDALNTVEDVDVSRFYDLAALLVGDDEILN